MTHPDTLQRAAFEAWANAAKLDTARCCKDSWGEATYLPHIDAMWAGWQAALQQHLKNGDKLYTSPPDPADLLRDALSNLNDLADQKNAEIDALKEAMRLALEALQLVPALIQYQFTGDRDTMNALQNASNACEAAIAALEGMVK